MVVLFSMSSVILFTVFVLGHAFLSSEDHSKENCWFPFKGSNKIIDCILSKLIFWKEIKMPISKLNSWCYCRHVQHMLRSKLLYSWCTIEICFLNPTKRRIFTFRFRRCCQSTRLKFKERYILRNEVIQDWILVRFRRVFKHQIFLDVESYNLKLLIFGIRTFFVLGLETLWIYVERNFRFSLTFIFISVENISGFLWA